MGRISCVAMKTNRRSAVRALAIGTMAACVPARAAAPLYKAQRDNIRQSVVPWCFRPMPAPELIGHAAALGLESVELVGTEHWPLLKDKGLVCAITSSHGFAKGFAHPAEHNECIASLRKSIDATSAAGWPNVITFSGFRRGLSDDEGIRNMVAGLKKIVDYAEERKVTLCLEMLNSRVDVEMKGHPDYFCDDIERTVEICRQVGSERMKVLFDIYHVQIMHGDVIRRIRKHQPYIAHYHTAGVPGRAEIDDSQELNYPAIMKAIAETGYRGYVGQEFIPTHDKVASLAEAVRICDV
jgi:hydroxypyruvate isomerase